MCARVRAYVCVWGRGGEFRRSRHLVVAVIRNHREKGTRVGGRGQGIDDSAASLSSEG